MNASALELARRPCPVCGCPDDSRVVAEANVDPERLGALAFASRKPPELMHHRLVECPVCDLLYATPAPTGAFLEDAYREAGFDSAEESRYAARTYSRLVGPLLEQAPPGGAALDIGTGDGAFLLELMRTGIDGVVGVEPSKAPVLAAEPEARARIRQGTFRAADFESETFDLATSFQTLEHVPDPLALCRDARELLHVGGAFVVVCHDRRASVNRLLGARSPIRDVEHLQLFSPKSLRELVERAGYNDVTVKRIANRYPLRYWVRLLPLAPPAKRRVLDALERSGLAARSLTARVGNIAAVGRRP